MKAVVRRGGSRAPLAYLAGLALASHYTFPLGSCTIILTNAGIASDARNPGPGLIPRESLVLLDARTPVLVHLADSTVLSGSYAGVDLGDPVAYRVAYEAWRSSQADSASWPAIGETVTAHGRSDPPWIRGRGSFAGFTVRGAAVEGRREGDPLSELRFGDDGTIGIGNRLHYHYDVHRAITAGMPVLTRIRVRTKPGGELRTVPWSDVEAVTVGKTFSRGATGAIVGLALDALIVVGVANGLRSARRPRGCD
ncbi:MAG TPA: hypothetical protein VFV33_03170, partial [Gemmatimonadaceae bacterium]|nr:hypothetical protein [Gemmatimonadaceae bacterium]